MAIRLRVIQGQWVALCAAKTVAKEEDIYLDDNAHYALACKFARDRTVEWNDLGNDALANAEETLIQ